MPNGGSVFSRQRCRHQTKAWSNPTTNKKPKHHDEHVEETSAKRGRE